MRPALIHAKRFLYSLRYALKIGSSVCFFRPLPERADLAAALLAVLHGALAVLCAHTPGLREPAAAVLTAAYGHAALDAASQRIVDHVPHGGRVQNRRASSRLDRLETQWDWLKSEQLPDLSAGRDDSFSPPVSAVHDRRNPRPAHIPKTSQPASLSLKTALQTPLSPKQSPESPLDQAINGNAAEAARI